MQTKALPGFRDFYPAELAFRTHIFNTWRAVAARYGFEEWDGPPLEPLELYTAKSGEEIVGQLYNFVDKGDRAVALRPEMTPSLARVVAARANGLRKPIRWFSIPQLFRYERQQRGRLREHFQLNCDLIGEAGPLADAEIIALAIDVMRAFGLGPGDVRLRLSDRRVLGALLSQFAQSDEQVATWYQVLDKFRRTPEAVSVERLRDAQVKQTDIDSILDLNRAKTWSDFEARAKGRAKLLEVAAPLGAVWNALQAMGLGEFIDLDLTIVRGIAYYTGTVFELFDAKGELRAICGGGRYDNLLQSLGGVDLPACGFGMGDVVLGELLKERNLAPAATSSIDLFVAAVTGDDVPHVLKLVHALRDVGMRVEYSLSGAAVGKQLNLADVRGARLAVVIGPDDRARGEVALKDLATKHQQSVSIGNLQSAIFNLLGRNG